mgnify:CR=1 FL=1
MEPTDPLLQEKKGGAWRWFAIGCGAIVAVGLLIGGGLVFLGYVGVKEIGKHVATNPAQAETLAREMMEFEMPGGAKGVMAIDMGFRMAVVGSREEPSPATLLLFEFPLSWVGDIEETVDQQIGEAMSDGKQYEIQAERTEDRVLCGRPVKVAIREGWMSKGNVRRPFTALQTKLATKDEIRLVIVIGQGDHRQEHAESLWKSLDCNF